jgi:transposase
VPIESGLGSIMGVAYSQDLRDRVMAAVDGGAYSAAPMFRVSVSYIYKALGRRRATGDVTAHKSAAGRSRSLRLTTTRCALGWRRRPTSRSSSCKPGLRTIID